MPDEFGLTDDDVVDAVADAQADLKIALSILSMEQRAAHSSVARLNLRTSEEKVVAARARLDKLLADLRGDNE